MCEEEEREREKKKREERRKLRFVRNSISMRTTCKSFASLVTPAVPPSRSTMTHSCKRILNQLCRKECERSVQQA